VPSKLTPNKFSSRNIRGKNCEDDDFAFLSTLTVMLSSDMSVMENSEGIVSRDSSIFPDSARGSTRRLIHQNDPAEDSLADYLQRNSTVSLAGKLTEKSLIGITCPVCIGAIRADVVTGDHAFLYLQDYNPNVPSSVLPPSKNIAAAVTAVQCIFHRDILPSLNLPKPCKRLKEATLQEVLRIFLRSPK